jgi:hypothetical protein
MNIMKNNLVNTKSLFPLPQAVSQTIVGGLIGLMDVDGGPTPEQSRIFNALAIHLLGVDMNSTSKPLMITPSEFAIRLPDTSYQRIFMQIASVLELCRHPKNEKQFRRLEEYAAVFKFDGVELKLLQDFAHLSATDATADFIRLYGAFTPELSEHYGKFPVGDRRGLDDQFYERICPMEAWAGHLLNFMIEVN